MRGQRFVYGRALLAAPELLNGLAAKLVEQRTGAKGDPHVRGQLGQGIGRAAQPAQLLGR
jgi:hypothetical protein